MIIDFDNSFDIDFMKYQAKMRFKKIKSLILCFFFFFIANCFGKQDTIIFEKPHTYPEFLYCKETNTKKSLENYFRVNFKMPKMLLDYSYHGMIIVQFVVEKNGSINNVEKLRGIDDDLDKIVLEFVKNMPNWIAGKNEGVFVRTRYVLPIPVIWLYGMDVEKADKSNSTN